MTIALLTVDDERRVVRVNEPATRLLGAPADQLVGQRIERFAPAEHYPRVDRVWARLQREGSLEGECELVRAHGAPAWVRVRACWRFAGGDHLLAAIPIAPPLGASAAALTRREREVLQLASDGRSTDEIARALFVSPATIKTHFERSYAKLGAHDRVAAVATALRGGLIS